MLAAEIGPDLLVAPRRRVFAELRKYGVPMETAMTEYGNSEDELGEIHRGGRSVRQVRQRYDSSLDRALAIWPTITIRTSTRRGCRCFGAHAAPGEVGAKRRPERRQSSQKHPRL